MEGSLEPSTSTIPTTIDSHVSSINTYTVRDIDRCIMNRFIVRRPRGGWMDESGWLSQQLPRRWFHLPRKPPSRPLIGFKNTYPPPCHGHWVACYQVRSNHHHWGSFFPRRFDSG
eukprot:4758916-Pyramimonas_sp.AAC.1